MKLIEKINNYIEEEIESAENYALCAIKHKDENSTLAQAFYNMSLDELKHVTLLHDEVVRLINQYKAENGSAPDSMKAVYDYLHEKHIERVADIKSLQNQYK